MARGDSLRCSRIPGSNSEAGLIAASKHRPRTDDTSTRVAGSFMRCRSEKKAFRTRILAPRFSRRCHAGGQAQSARTVVPAGATTAGLHLLAPIRLGRQHPLRAKPHTHLELPKHLFGGRGRTLMAARIQNKAANQSYRLLYQRTIGAHLTGAGDNPYPRRLARAGHSPDGQPTAVSIKLNLSSGPTPFTYRQGGTGKLAERGVLMFLKIFNEQAREPPCYERSSSRR
jgi:hypothetical protein